MKKLLLYLDNCCYNRPFDDQSSLSVFLETQAKLTIQTLVKDGMLSLVWSFILDFENNANPEKNVKEEIFGWRAISSFLIRYDEDILKRAKKLTQLNFGKKDALHITCACKVKANFFITVDKAIIRKSNLVTDIKILNPIDFINYLEEKK